VPDWAEVVPDQTIEALRDEYMPELPPLGSGGYLVAFLFEVGPVMSGSMGAAPLPFGEIDAWCRRSGIELSPWEARALRRLSVTYLNESQAAEKRSRQPPWQAPGDKPIVTDAQAALRALAREA
jgi:hypothetical protein